MTSTRVAEDGDDWGCDARTIAEDGDDRGFAVVKGGGGKERRYKMEDGWKREKTEFQLR